MKNTTPIYNGPSSDGRTNKWKIQCPKCSYIFEPRTTRFSVQRLTCARCLSEMWADYNKEVVTLLETP